MDEGGCELRAFLGELKRRHVYRIAVVYIAVAFVIIEAASFIFPALLLADWSFRLLVVLALLGERERAVMLLREAFAQGYPYTLVLHTDIDLESLRDYPLFQELLRPKG